MNRFIHSKDYGYAFRNETERRWFRRKHRNVWHDLIQEDKKGKYVYYCEAYTELPKEEKDAIEILSIGSSLKFCLVAEGSADIYPRFSPTMEWDTAAGHAIANYAGKKVIDLVSKKEITYNRKNLKNNWFIVE